MFRAEIDLGHFVTEHQKEISDALQEAIYDTLDDLGVDYQVLVASVSEVEDGDPSENGIGGFRGGDPDTSRKGAIDVYPRSGSHRHAALLSIARSGAKGRTYAEVEEDTGIKGIWKRISELKEGGWVVPFGERLVRETGSRADIYHLTKRGQRYIRDKEHVL